MTAFPLKFDYRARAMLALFAALMLVGIAIVEGSGAALSALGSARGDLQAARTAMAGAHTGARESEVRKALEADLLPGESSAQAQASLQTAVKALGERHSAEISDLQPMPSSEVGGLSLSRVQMQAGMPEAQFPLFLKDLVASQPALLATALEVSPLVAASSADGAPGPRKVFVRMEIAAFARIPVPSGSTAP